MKWKIKGGMNMRHWRSIPGFIAMVGLTIVNLIVCTEVDRYMDKRR